MYRSGKKASGNPAGREPPRGVRGSQETSEEGNSKLASWRLLHVLHTSTCAFLGLMMLCDWLNKLCRQSPSPLTLFTADFSVEKCIVPPFTLFSFSPI